MTVRRIVAGQREIVVEQRAITTPRRDRPLREFLPSERLVEQPDGSLLGHLHGRRIVLVPHILDDGRRAWVLR